MRALRKLLTTIGRRERGATMVEYVLLVAVIAGISIVAVRALSASASEEVSTQSACVSQRPQPASCSAAAVDVTSTTAAPVSSSSTTTTAPSAATTTSTSTTAPPTTTTTATPTTTAAPTTTTIPTWSGKIESFNASKDRGQIKVSVTVNPTKGSDKDLEVVFSYRFSDGTAGTASCKTDKDGKCSTLFPRPSRWDDVVVTIDSVAGLAVSPPETDTVTN